MISSKSEMLKALQTAYNDLKLADALSQRGNALKALKRYEAALPVIREQLGAEHFVTNAVYCKLAVAQERVRALVKVSVPAFTAASVGGARDRGMGRANALVTLLYIAVAEIGRPPSFCGACGPPGILRTTTTSAWSKLFRGVICNASAPWRQTASI